MANIEMILSIFFVFLLLGIKANKIAWENCDRDSTSIKLLNLTVNPYPIVIPGSISIEVTARINQNITSPIKVDLTLHRKLLFSYISVPCVSGIGSCTYDDLCSLCPQCGCPLTAGDHTVRLPISVYVDSWALVGNYQAKVDIRAHSGEKGCVKVENIHIKSSK